MKKAFATVFAAGLIVGLAACGGGGSSPTATTTSAGAALLLARQTSVGLLGLSSSPAHLVRLELPMEFSNASVVPCNLNYVRLQLFDATDAEVERAEVTAEDIVALAGTNRVIQGTPLDVTLIFNFNTLEIPRAAITANAVDDNGHTFDREIESIDVELAPELQEAQNR